MTNSVVSAILGVTSNQQVQEAMLLGSHLESNWDPTAVGDNGSSFGPFQMHIGGALTAAGGTPQQAEDPVWAAQHMLAAYEAGVNSVPQSLWQSNPEQAAEQAAVYAEKPAQSYFASQGNAAVDSAWQATLSAMSNPNGTGPYQGVPALNIPGVPNSSSIAGSLIQGLLTAFGLGSAKDLAERAGLILFGGLLIIMGIVITFKGGHETKITTTTSGPEGTTTTKGKEKESGGSGGSKVEEAAEVAAVA